MHFTLMVRVAHAAARAPAAPARAVLLPPGGPARGCCEAGGQPRVGAAGRGQSRRTGPKPQDRPARLRCAPPPLAADPGPPRPRSSLVTASSAAGPARARDPRPPPPRTWLQERRGHVRGRPLQSELPKNVFSWTDGKWRHVAPVTLATEVF